MGTFVLLFWHALALLVCCKKIPDLYAQGLKRKHTAGWGRKYQEDYEGQTVFVVEK